MRRSKLYNKYVNPENGPVATQELAEKYTYSSHLGDQVNYTRDVFNQTFFSSLSISALAEKNKKEKTRDTGRENVKFRTSQLPKRVLGVA